MTALDRIQDVADMLAEWPTNYGWVNDINRVPGPGVPADDYVVVPGSVWLDRFGIDE